MGNDQGVCGGRIGWRLTFPRDMLENESVAPEASSGRSLRHRVPLHLTQASMKARIHLLHVAHDSEMEGPLAP
jgi:hypothetical protein